MEVSSSTGTAQVTEVAQKQAESTQAQSGLQALQQVDNEAQEVVRDNEAQEVTAQKTGLGNSLNLFG
jgi:hypothetical protein